jgi:hypothetical protein
MTQANEKALGGIPRTSKIGKLFIKSNNSISEKTVYFKPVIRFSGGYHGKR